MVRPALHDPEVVPRRCFSSSPVLLCLAHFSVLPPYVRGKWPSAIHAMAARMNRDGSMRVLSSGFCHGILVGRRYISNLRPIHRCGRFAKRPYKEKMESLIWSKCAIIVLSAPEGCRGRLESRMDASLHKQTHRSFETLRSAHGVTARARLAVDYINEPTEPSWIGDRLKPGAARTEMKKQTHFIRKIAALSGKRGVRHFRRRSAAGPPPSWRHNAANCPLSTCSFAS